MIFISPVLNTYIKFRLKNKGYRIKIYKKALEKQLSVTKMGRIILRNVGDEMAQNSHYHTEFANLKPNENYQKLFWESDLGYLWYEANLQSKNKYFELAIDEIKKNKIASILDVGCGWGSFCNEISKLESVKKAVGIDISEKIITEAKEKYKTTKAIFIYKDVLSEIEHFDLITLFGSTDYIAPDEFKKVLTHIIMLANKEIIIVNSLRGIPFEKAMNIEEAIEVQRYDDGYLQPLNFLIKEIQKNTSIHFEIFKFGQDSIIAKITKL